MNSQAPDRPDADQLRRWITAAFSDQRTKNLARKLCWTDADDALQEAASRVLERMDRIEGQTEPQVGCYVRRTVSTCAMDIHRRRSRAQPQLDSDDSLNAPGDSQNSSPFIPERRSIEISRLNEALMQLDAEERSVFEDKFLSEISSVEIAAARGRDRRKVDRQIAETIRKLKKALGDDGFSVLMGR